MWRGFEVVDAEGKGKTGHRERLRERFLLGEASSRTDETLLELLLTFCIPRRDGQPLVKALLVRFDSLDKVLAADQPALCSVEGVESHVSTLLKLVDYICQARNPPLPASGLQEHPGPVAAPTPQAPRRPEPERMESIPLAQSEMPLNLPGQPELPLARRAPAVRERKTLQDVLLAEGLMALKLAHEVKSPEELQDILVKRLGQNSMETRRRYAQSVVRWFFPDGLNGLLPRVWRAYEDDAIALDLLRWSYLNQEPIMGRCVAEALFPCETGLAMPATYFDKFLQDHLGEAPPEKTRERLKSNLKRIGFLERANGKPDRLRQVVTQKTSFLIVKSIGLLARYNVGLKAFYDWFIGDFTMVVLLLDGGSENVDWPEEVRCEGNRLQSYFSEPGMVKEVFSTSG